MTLCTFLALWGGGLSIIATLCAVALFKGAGGD